MGNTIGVVADVGQHVFLHHGRVIDVVEELRPRRTDALDHLDAPLGRIAHVVPVVDRVQQLQADRHFLPLGVTGDLLHADHAVFESLLVVQALAIARERHDIRKSGVGRGVEEVFGLGDVARHRECASTAFANGRRGGVDALAQRGQALVVILQPVQSLGDAVAGGHGADQAVLLQRGPLLGRGQFDRPEPHFRAGRSELIEVHFGFLQIVAIAPVADRLLDPALEFGGPTRSGKRPRLSKNNCRMSSANLSASSSDRCGFFWRKIGFSILLSR